MSTDAVRRSACRLDGGGDPAASTTRSPRTPRSEGRNKTMVTATNVDATAVNTIAWLSAADDDHRRPGLPAAVPLGHRRLRAAARRHPRRRRLRRPAHPLHRLDPLHRRAPTATARPSSCSSTASSASPRSCCWSPRCTTPSRDERPGARRRAASACSCAPGDPQPHEAAPAPRLGRGLRERRARPPRRRTTSCATRASTTTTRSSAARCGAEEAPRIWRGLQKLEHVAITLGADANAQQIFESLNSTGEPLRDHELIHNYVLMGLTHAEQSEIEDAFWLPIEQNTGESDRQLLAALPGDDDRPRGRRRRRARRVRRVPAASSRGSTSRPCARTPPSGARTPRSTASCSIPPQAPDPEIARQLGLREHLRPRHVSARHARLPRLSRGALGPRRA